MPVRPATTTGLVDRPWRPAVSVIEILLACAIAGSSFLPLIGLLSSVRQQTQQTSDYGLALMLEEKVAEELRLANWENTHLKEQLEASGWCGVDRSILDGVSPFFSAIEDDAPPFGLIRPGEDRALGPVHRTLYPALTSFRLGLFAVPSNLPTTWGIDLSLVMRWSDFRSRERSSELAVRLSSYGVKKVPPREVEDRKMADGRIQQLLYPGDLGRTLQEIVVASRADPKTIRDLGDVVVLVRALSDSETDFRSQRSEAEKALAASRSPEESARFQLVVARLHEQRAAAALHVMEYLIDPLRALASSLTLDMLGDPRPPRHRYMGQVLRLDWVPSVFQENTRLALEGYVTAFNHPLGARLPPRVRIRSFMKVVELLKLISLTFCPDALKVLQTAQKAFIDWQDGRNRNFHDFFVHDLSLSRDISSLQASYRSDCWRSWDLFYDHSRTVALKLITIR